MSIVGAYVELPPGDTLPEPYTDNFIPGAYVGKTPDGLSVSWPQEVPQNAQVYLAWRPVVWAYWNDEKEEEENEGSNGIEAGNAGKDDAEESDQSTEQAGGVGAVVHATEAEEQ